jgi:HAE1 family hydrophobic/amphiphilic exporter-1
MIFGRRGWSAIGAAAVLMLEAAGQAAAQQPDAVRPRMASDRALEASAERTLTLRDAVALAAKQNLDIQIEQSEVALASDGIGGAQGAFDGVLHFRPQWQSDATPVGSLLLAPDGRLVNRNAGGQLSYTQSLSRFGSRVSAAFDNARLETSDAFVQIAPYYTSRLSFGLVQPLMRGFRADPAAARVEVRRGELRAATTTARLQLVDVIAGVEDAYWELVAARQQVDVHREAVALAEEQLAINRRMLQSGGLARVEIAGAEAELERRRDDVYRSTAGASASENRLKALLGGGLDDAIWRERIVPIDATLQADSSDAEELGSLMALARQRRLELKEIGDRESIVETERRLAADQKLPDLTLFAEYARTGLAGTRRPANPLVASFVPAGMFSPNLEGDYGRSLSNLFGGQYQTFQVGLSLDLNLRNRAAAADHSQAVTAAQRLRLERRKAEQTISRQVRDAVDAIVSARQRLAAAEASTRAAREKLESESRLFEVGDSTNFMVLTRQNELAMSRLRATAATVDLNRALARLRQSVGATLQAYGLE